MRSRQHHLQPVQRHAELEANLPTGNRLTDVLLLAPSAGLGGGIERHLASVEDALGSSGCTVRRLDLTTAARPLSLAGRTEFVARAAAAVARRPTAVVGGHPHVAAVVAALAKRPGCYGTVFYYGHDIWGMSALGRRLIRTASWVRPVTISSYSAGALAAVGVQARVLPPVVPADLRDRLLRARPRPPAGAAAPRLVSVCRLSEWVGKGLPVLVAALDLLRSQGTPVELVVAGRGPVPDDLARLLQDRPHIQLVPSPDDDHLPKLYAQANLAVLCTRTTVTPPYQGEGFGLVLTEAQLAGTPVVAPASGGSSDAYLAGVTGWAPADESAQTLARLLGRLLADRPALRAAGAQARTWAAEFTDPKAHAERTSAVLLGRAAVPAPEPAAGNPPRAAAAGAVAHATDPDMTRTPAQRLAYRPDSDVVGIRPRRTP